MQLINFTRAIDGIVFSVFLLCLGGFGLFMFGQLHTMCVVTEAKKLGIFANLMNRIFPFPDKKYEFNLSHVMMFSLLIAILSMVHHPAQDVIEQEGEKEAKKKKDKKSKTGKGD